MKHKILLISKPSYEQRQLISKLDSDPGLDTIVCHTSEDSIKRLKRQHVDLLILNIDQFDFKKIRIAENLRHLGFDFPLLTLANSIALDAYLKIDEIPNTVLLEKPFANQTLLGLAHKLINGEAVKQQIYRRFNTNQNVRIEVYPEGELVDSTMTNLSKGGAKFTLNKEALVHIGDVVRVNVSLNQVHRKYDMHGQVIWHKQKQNDKESNELGIKFLNGDEIYSNLMYSV